MTGGNWAGPRESQEPMAQGGSGAYVAYGLHFVQVVMVAHRVKLAEQVVQHRHQLLSPHPPSRPMTGQLQRSASAGEWPPTIITCTSRGPTAEHIRLYNHSFFDNTL